MQLSLRGLRKDTDYEIIFTKRNQTLQAASTDLLYKGIAIALVPPATPEVVLIRTRK